jgi:hypothetical protein
VLLSIPVFLLHRKQDNACLCNYDIDILCARIARHCTCIHDNQVQLSGIFLNVVEHFAHEHFRMCLMADVCSAIPAAA